MKCSCDILKFSNEAYTFRCVLSVCYQSFHVQSCDLIWSDWWNLSRADVTDNRNWCFMKMYSGCVWKDVFDIVWVIIILSWLKRSKGSNIPLKKADRKITEMVSFLMLPSWFLLIYFLFYRGMKKQSIEFLSLVNS